MMKKKVVIFGAGGTGRELYKNLIKDPTTEIVAFADSFRRGKLFDLDIVSPDRLNDLEYDLLYIETVAAGTVVEELKAQKIDINKMVQSVVTMKADPREQFLMSFSEEIKRKGIAGNIAEAGVFRGDFAKVINHLFPDRKLYLFDTFEGFDERDIKYEEGYEKDPERGLYFKETSVELVMSKMEHPDSVMICKGYVPESFEDIDDRFCFVNLDMDLYKPTLEALRWFYPRLVDGGGILIHDYFDTYNFPNLKQAVIEFCDETGAGSVPIGDRLSVFIMK